MALDTKQKRMSAMDLAAPWRGPLVDAPEAGFTQGNRQAADLLYSGILAAAVATGGGGGAGASMDEPPMGAADRPIPLGDIGG